MASEKIHQGVLILGMALLLAACSSQQADLSFETDPKESRTQDIVESSPTIVFGEAISPAPPTSTPPATPTTGPVLYELLRLRGYLRDTQSTLLELYQEVPDISPSERLQIEQQIVELMAETARFMETIEYLMDQASPEDREAAKGNLQRLQADLQGIRSIANGNRSGANVDASPTPPPLAEVNLSMADLVYQMENVQQQVSSRLQQLSTEQLQAVVGTMADVIGDLDELTGYTALTISRLEMHQQEAFADRGKAIYDVVMRMEWASSEETPSPWIYPLGP